MREGRIRRVKRFLAAQGIIITVATLSIAASAIAQTENTSPLTNEISLEQKAMRPHCGLYCLYLVIKMSGQDPNFLDLVTPEYLDAPRGSTLSGLMRAAEDAGLHTDIMDKGTSRVLRVCPYTVILHVRGNDTSKQYDHFVLFLGTEGGQARICNPPEHVKLVPFAELTSHWDGKGLVLSTGPINIKGAVWGERLRLLMISGAMIFLILLIHVAQRRIPWPQAWSRPAGKAMVSMVQIGVLAVISLIIALCFHSVSEAGFLAYPKGVASVKKAHAADFIPRISLSTARKLQGTKVVFVDARRTRDFNAGHIDGAVNIPVDANDAMRRDRVKEVPGSVPLVVYCQSARCKYAEVVALKLRADGFSKISIFQGGWLAWSGWAQPTQPRSSTRKSSGKWRVNNDGTASPQ